MIVKVVQNQQKFASCNIGGNMRKKHISLIRKVWNMSMTTLLLSHGGDDDCIYHTGKQNKYMIQSKMHELTAHYTHWRHHRFVLMQTLL